MTPSSAIRPNTLPLQPGDDARAQDYLERAAALLPFFEKDAVERDKRGGRPAAQIEAIKQAGLANLLISRELGGEGQPWSTALEIVRLFSTVDGSLGHLFGYHTLCQAGMWTRTNPAQARLVLRESAASNAWWGNSNDPLSQTVKGRRVDGGHIVGGSRPFSSGSHVADYLQISWEDDDTKTAVYAAVPLPLKGIAIHNDWNGIGQRQTGSGTVSFHDAYVADEHVLQFDYNAGRPYKSIGASLSQSILLNVFLGTAQGALQAARDYTVSHSRPWRTSGVERHIDDPWIKRRYGEFDIRISAAVALADQALASVDSAWARGDALSPEERGANAVLVAKANVFAGEVALEVTSTIFEVMGARSASANLAFDRFWRNVRTHTLHNPAEYKIRTVGNWVLTGEYPDVDIYQ